MKSSVSLLLSEFIAASEVWFTHEGCDAISGRCRYFWNYGNQSNGGLSPTDTVGSQFERSAREMIQFDRISRFRIRPAEKFPRYCAGFLEFPARHPAFSPHFFPSSFVCSLLPLVRKIEPPPFGKLPSSHDARNRWADATVHLFLSLSRSNDEFYREILLESFESEFRINLF